MKKLSSLFIGLIVIMVSCHKEDAKAPSQDLQDAKSAQVSQRSCGAAEVLDRQLREDPSLRKRLADLEAMTGRFIKGGLAKKMAGTTINIPVVVHVVYNTAAENISNAQVQSQIDVLNEDYNNTNGDRTQVPAEFTDEQTSVGIRFTLAQVVRVNTTKKSWNTNDAVKKTKMGGSDPVNPAKYLNMWACNLGQSLLGYAQFPGGNPATDGVVILYSAFGRTGTLIAKYDRGRTATHEVGHWINLRHIWGDANCGNDLVDDTPPAQTANFNCPGYPKNTTCTGGKAEMTMNYMDYTDDACMYMFTNGQKSRALAVFAAGGPRATIGK